jgi:hypothetical protein
MIDRNRAQQETVDRREDGGVCADAERERQDDDERPGLAAQQEADGVLQVSDQGFSELRRPEL